MQVSAQPAKARISRKPEAARLNLSEISIGLRFSPFLKRVSSDIQKVFFGFPRKVGDGHALSLAVS